MLPISSFNWSLRQLFLRHFGKETLPGGAATDHPFQPHGTNPRIRSEHKHSKMGNKVNHELKTGTCFDSESTGFCTRQHWPRYTTASLSTTLQLQHAMFLRYPRTHCHSLLVFFFVLPLSECLSPYLVNSTHCPKHMLFSLLSKAAWTILCILSLHTQ